MCCSSSKMDGVINPRSEGYSSRSVCLCVWDYSRTIGYKAAYE